MLVLITRTLRQYDLTKLIEALRDVGPIRLVLAVVFAAASYFMLTLFDTLAIRYLDLKLPYYKIAWASFTSLSIGHNIGLAALSSGAIRYRFYSQWGLSAEEIGKLILFCALTVGLGLLTLGGMAALLRADLASEFLRLSTSLVYGLGALCLAIPAGWVVLAMRVRRPIRLWTWRVIPPGPGLAIAQIVVGAVNFAFVAATLHQALLTAVDIGYLGVATVYVIGSAAAIISHVPGGLGVIEGIVMYLVPQADLLSAVILFRAVYFLIPLPIGVTSLLLAEWHRRRKSASPQRSAVAS